MAARPSLRAGVLAALPAALGVPWEVAVAPGGVLAVVEASSAELAPGPGPKELLAPRPQLPVGPAAPLLEHLLLEPARLGGQCRHAGPLEQALRPDQSQRPAEQCPSVAWRHAEKCQAAKRHARLAVWHHAERPQAAQRQTARRQTAQRQVPQHQVASRRMVTLRLQQVVRQTMLAARAQEWQAPFQLAAQAQLAHTPQGQEHLPQATSVHEM